MQNQITKTIACALAVSACAVKPESVAPSYVSELTYSSHSCEQIAQEMTRYQHHLATLSGQQNKARKNDITGVVFLGLPVSTLSGNNVAGQIAEAKGHVETLSKVSVKNNCATELE